MMRTLRSIIVVVGLTLAINACGPGTAPAGQPPMVTLTAETLETLQQQFNAAADGHRVILLLSPT